MKYILAALLMLPLSAHAGNKQAMRKTVEASMQVTGEVMLTADGKLQSYTIDKPEALPADVNRLLALYLPSCVFDVVTASGKPETVKARMNLQLVGRQTDAGSTTISVHDSIFEDPDTPRYITAKSMPAPAFPVAAIQAGMSGVVYVVLRLNPDGSVADAHVEQVNMTALATTKTLQRARDVLAQASLQRAKSWKFAVAPELAAKPAPVSVRVPVMYLFWDQALPKYGKWQAYVPGPYAPPPWEKRTATSGIGAMTSGRLYPLDSTIKLRDPPAAGS